MQEFKDFEEGWNCVTHVFRATVAGSDCWVYLLDDGTIFSYYIDDFPDMDFLGVARYTSRWLQKRYPFNPIYWAFGQIMRGEAQLVYKRPGVEVSLLPGEFYSVVRKDEPKNNDGRQTCYSCGAPTKAVSGFMVTSTYNVCTRCGK